MLDVTVYKLRQDRSQKRGLPFIKFGKLVRYSASEVDTYLNARRVVFINSAQQGGQE